MGDSLRNENINNNYFNICHVLSIFASSFRNGRQILMSTVMQVKKEFEQNYHLFSLNFINRSMPKILWRVSLIVSYEKNYY